MPPKFTPRAPQVGRYWPGKPLKEDEESSSEEEDEDEDEEEEKPQVTPAAKVDQGSVGPGKLITTMKTTKLSEQGPYMEAEEESESESDSEEEEADEQDKRRLKIRQANRRATGDFVAVDRVDLEEEGEEVMPEDFENANVFSRTRNHRRKSQARKIYYRNGCYCDRRSSQSTSPSRKLILISGTSENKFKRTETT